MSQPPSREAPAASWPEGGLERVPRCPVCEGERRRVLFAEQEDWLFRSAPGRWTSYRCDDCGAGYLDPRPTRETLHLAYASYYTHEASEPPVGGGADLRSRLRNGYLNHRYGYALRPALALGYPLLRLARLQRARVEASVRHAPRKDGGRLLDVGCGSGEFLVAMRAQGWDAVGLELDPAAAAVARSAGLQIFSGTVEDAPLQPGSFDLITLSHVIEHLHDPLAAVRRCRTLLRPGGMLWLATPNLDAAARHAFGIDWRGLEPPRHLVLFNFSALRRLFERADWHAELRPIYGAHGMTAMGRVLRERRTGAATLGGGRWNGVLDRAFEACAFLVPQLSQNVVAIAHG